VSDGLSIGGGVLCSFRSSTQGPVGPESGSVTAGKGDSFVWAGLLSVFFEECGNDVLCEL
jgi:hypothetical protein